MWTSVFVKVSQESGGELSPKYLEIAMCLDALAFSATANPQFAEEVFRFLFGQCRIDTGDYSGDVLDALADVRLFLSNGRLPV